MLKKYFQKKSKLSIAIDVVIGILIILVLIPATRKDVAAFILKPTLIIHQPKVLSKHKDVNDAAFSWQLKNNYGETVQLSDFKDKVVFINLWATWCPPCIAEMPDLQKLYSDYGASVAFLFISNENTEVVNQFIEKKGFTLPTYKPLTQYPADFETNSLPTTFILSKEGKIVVEKKGVAKWNSKRIRGVLDALVKE